MKFNTFTENRLVFHEVPRNDLDRSTEQARRGVDDTPQADMMDGAKKSRDQMLTWESNPRLQDIRGEIQNARHGVEQVATQYEQERQRVQDSTEQAGDVITTSDGMFTIENGEYVIGDVSTSEIAEDSDGFIDFWRNLSEQDKKEILAPLVGMIPLSGMAEALSGTSYTGEELDFLDRVFTAGLDIGGKPLKVIGGPILFGIGAIRVFRRTKGVASKAKGHFGKASEDLRTVGRGAGEAVNLSGKSEGFVSNYIELNAKELVGQSVDREGLKKQREVLNSLRDYVIANRNMTPGLKTQIDQYYVYLGREAERLNVSRVLNSVDLARQSLNK